ncbi:copper chaperone PCu(A)C [Acetobacter musti]|uniref:Copper chaperone PCu(A)C n=1 Tax=Acetobacter musti TaxID=864732 RepID=A0ABX0JS79_9PROT|nr:copper chaperone PCu(A)C [Acetobacter musti]NHN85677.1 copper chaperone PCu(A)C [Acetobacter musti]
MLRGAAVLGLLCFVSPGLAAEDAGQPEPMKSSLGQEAEMRAGAVGASVPGQENAAGDIAVHDAWMQHVGAGADLVAAYFSVENTSDAAHLIDRITSPSCEGMFGYHTDLEVSTLTRDLFTHLTVPPKETLVFPPGGYHLVCHVAPGVTVSQGSTVNVEFHFLGGSRKMVAFQVREAKPHHSR